MKNLLLFNGQYRQNVTIESFEYGDPQYRKNTLMIYGGSRRQDLPPSYVMKFYPDCIPENWQKVGVLAGAKMLWRPKPLTFYEIMHEDGAAAATNDPLKKKPGENFMHAGSSFKVVDMFDVGNPVSEEKHAYAVSNQTWVGYRTFMHTDGAPVADTGRAFKGEHRFRISNCTPDRDVTFMKRIDGGVKHPRSDLYVNNRLAAVLAISEDCPTGQWGYIDIIIPGRFVTGPELVVREKFISSDVDVNAFLYLFLQPE